MLRSLAPVLIVCAVGMTAAADPQVVEPDVRVNEVRTADDGSAIVTLETGTGPLTLLVWESLIAKRGTTVALSCGPA